MFKYSWCHLNPEKLLCSASIAAKIVMRLMGASIKIPKNFFAAPALLQRL
jgi:hypothetical protein